MSLPRAGLLVLCLLGAGVGAPTPALSQPSGSSSPDSTRADAPTSPFAPSWNRVSVWAGGSGFNSRFIGKIPQSTIAMVGVRYHRRLAPSPGSPSGGLTYTYTIDVLPAALVSLPGGLVPRTSLGASTVATDAITTVGVGGAPIGLRLNYRTGGAVQPYVAGRTGALYFAQALPDPRGERLNFMVDAGGGVQVALSPATTLTVGYRYYHLSNGFRGAINPGIDAHLFHLGVTVVP